MTTPLNDSGDGTAGASDALVDEELLSQALRSLVEALAVQHPEELHVGLLGGEFGYGMDVVTSLFEMHPYYEGECTCGADERGAAWSKVHAHGAACYQAGFGKLERDYPDSYGAQALEFKRAEEALCALHQIPWNGGWGSARHCTCGFSERWQAWILENGHHARCPVELANFIHLPSGATVSWYKWIGRDMDIQAPVGFDWAGCLEACRQSVGGPGALK